MISGRPSVLLIAGLIAGAGVMPAKPPVFQDSFSQESSGNPTTNYTRFAKWVVARGSVDLIGKGSSQVVADFYPGNDLYVDLDGSNIEAGPGRMESKNPLRFEPGEYKFEFELGGNSEGSSENSVTVSIGEFFKETFRRPNVTPPAEFERIVRTFTVTEPVYAKIVFDADGPSDYYGLIIDNVKLGPVRQPPSLAAVLGGVVLLGAAAVAGVLISRRRKRLPASSMR